jgi:hypothetical protein
MFPLLFLATIEVVISWVDFIDIASFIGSIFYCMINAHYNVDNFTEN